MLSTVLDARETMVNWRVATFEEPAVEETEDNEQTIDMCFRPWLGWLSWRVVLSTDRSWV